MRVWHVGLESVDREAIMAPIYETYRLVANDGFEAIADATTEWKAKKSELDERFTEPVAYELHIITELTPMKVKEARRRR